MFDGGMRRGCELWSDFAAKMMQAADGAVAAAPRPRGGARDAVGHARGLGRLLGPVPSLAPVPGR